MGQCGSLIDGLNMDTLGLDMTRGLWGLALVLAGCGGQALGPGPSPDGGADGPWTAPVDDATVPAEAGPPEAGPSGASIADAAALPVASLYGTWVGYIESYQFPDGSDAVTMTISPAPDGSLDATVLFGAAPALPPPTNPDIGPIPGLVGYPYFDAGTPLGEGEAVSMTGQPVSYDAGALSVGLTVEARNAQWCAIQTRIYGWQEDGGGPPYGCLPNWPGVEDLQRGCTQSDPSTDASVPVDCEKFGLCFGQGTTGTNICECSASECHIAATYLQPNITLDLHLSAGRLDGSVAGVFGTHNVHLTKSGP
jgi:hypothetical protein